jgi:hypothetical protein
MFIPNRITVLFVFFCIFPLRGQIVINEISVKPGTSASNQCQQTMADCNAGNSGCGLEYIELYNNSDCPVNIGCFILCAEGVTTGQFRFPSGTIIPPRGFYTVGGGASSANVILSGFCANNHYLSTDTRFYLENGDGWVALYDATGNLLDAVFWTFSSGESSKWPADSDLNGTFSAPAATASSCPSLGALPRPTTVGSGATQIEYAGVSPTLGNVLERTVDAGGTWAIGAATRNNCNGVCAILGTCAPLPIELYEFDLSMERDQVFVYWNTQSEAATDFFRVERSVDGEDWKIIGVVEASGYSNTIMNYEFVDVKPFKGMSYYRLTSFDLDGAISYKGVRSVETHTEVFVYPNPSKDDFFIRNVGDASLGSIVVLDVYGRIIGQFNSENWILKIDASSWKSGLYYVIVESGKIYRVLKEE